LILVRARCSFRFSPSCLRHYYGFCWLLTIRCYY